MKIEPGAQGLTPGIVEEEDTPSSLAAGLEETTAMNDAQTQAAQVAAEGLIQPDVILVQETREQKKKRGRVERELNRLLEADAVPVDKGLSCPSCMCRVPSTGAHACFVCRRIMHGIGDCGQQVPGEGEMARICIPCVSVRDGQGKNSK